ncbi:MAG: C10 family peptidase [Bacteroidales bacterium]|nr:C10 family peptidase [Bacteroidales bacterium]
MKKIVLLFLMLSLGLSVFCSPVSIQTAQRAAESFWAQMNGSKVSFVGSQTEFTEFYVFNNQIGEGFVLVSADDIAHPILGYSDKGSFRTDVQLPVNVRGWFKGISKEISSAVELGVQQSEEVREEWNSLLEGTAYPKRSTRAVSALLSTTWDQGKPYNNLCPADANTDSYYGGRTVTGCVATAMAQVMKYWNYPTQGSGSHSYSSSYGTLSANFGNTTYDWTNMPNNLTNYSSSAQKTAVATLMYHCGIAVEMSYDIAENGGSGAYTVAYGNTPCAKSALVTYFKYKSSIQGLFRASYSDTNWKNLLKADLDAGRPIMYSGASDEGGHSFVCDGYNNSDQFHFNWGWSGSYDGFFSLNAMTPGSGGIGGAGYDFSEDQDAIIGIEPAGITVSPTTVQLPSAGGSATVTVTAGSASTSWSATSSASWVSFTPTTGSGNGSTTTMTISASANNSNSTRNATITLTQGTQTATVTVTQLDAAAEACYVTNEDIMSDDSTATSGVGSNIYYSTYFTKIAEKIDVTGNYTIDKITFPDMLNTATSGNIAIKVWSATSAGAPNAELYSANVSMTTINNALTTGQLTNGTTCYYGAYEHTLTSPVVASGPFFVGIDFTSLGAGNSSTMSNVVCIADNQNHDLDNTAYIYSIYSGYTGWKLITNFFEGVDEAKFAIQAHICPTDEQPNVLSVSPSTLSYTAAGESKTVTVTSNVSWTATSSASWLTLSPTSGSNNGTITAVAAANTSTSQRTATITVSASGVSSQTISVTQAGESGGSGTGDCVVLHEDRFDSPTVYSVQDDGGYVCGSNSYGDQAKAEYFELSGNYNITSIDFAYAIDGTDGSVTFKVWANNNGTPGSELASQTVTLSNLYSAATSQSGIMIGSYTWTLSSPVAISTNFFAGFDVSSATSYIGLLSTAQGSGYTNSCYELYNGSWGDMYTNWQELDISMYVLPTVCPTGTTPSYNLTVSPSSLSYTADGASKTVNVTSNTSWTATSSASWLTISPASGTNNGTITAVAAANTSSSQRTATITVSGGGITRTVSVTQAGVSYNLTVSPSSLSYTADGESKTVNVTSNTSWTATSSENWLTVSPASGSNNGTITAVAAANSSTSQRTATITVSGSGITRTINVTQAGAPTAIDEEVAEGISVYPNPTSGMFTVGLGAIKGKATCQIVNANGSIIETREVNADDNSEIVFNCNVNSGVYFVRIISDNNVWTKRVVIEK